MTTPADPRLSRHGISDGGALAIQEAANPHGISRIQGLNGNPPGFETPLPQQDDSLSRTVGGDPLARGD